ncbi:ABC transporter substrate-binding protein [Corynebacterium hansenii]|uniref:ABC transporter substrate-binding protein n=1 Tax=Corynebacterium hansenii TaxID=394964 RepID=A0ABV7ZQD5_9CORY|nr:ABC transporter substrate-binding protein [Corynebacterium hansenii]WJZ01073.1 sn-glycerol-3-phosphate-binding periplasmic protein UgpB precursor [Corynebacterium hansenii]
MNDHAQRLPNGVNRRTFLALLGLTGAGAALTACAGTGGGGGGAEGDPNTIVWWSNHLASSKAIEEELISRFEKENPDLKVRLVDGGKNYEELGQKFNAALSGTDLPDVVVLSDVWWFNFALNEQIANIDDVAKRAGVDTSTYVESLYEDYALNGGHYAMPFARSTPLFYYNKDLWKKAGLPDRGPESWEEMTEWGKKLQDKMSGREHAHGWGNAVDYLSWTFSGPLWTLGGAYSDGWDMKLTSPETVKAVEWLKSTVDDGWATVSNDLANEFGTGLLGSVVASTGDLAGILETADFEVGTAFLPNPKGDGGCPTGGAGLAIPAGISEERQNNAAKFIDFITNTANTSYWSRNVGYMPVRKDAVDDAEQKKFMEDNPNFRTAVEQLPETRPQDNARVFIPNGDRKIGDALETILLTGAGIEPTLSALEKELTGTYERDIKPKL